MNVERMSRARCAFPAALFTILVGLPLLALGGATEFSRSLPDLLVPAWETATTQTAIVAVLTALVFAAISFILARLSADPDGPEGIADLLEAGQRAGNRENVHVFTVLLLIAVAGVVVVGANEGRLLPWMVALPIAVALAGVQALRCSGAPEEAPAPPPLAEGKQPEGPPDAAKWWASYLDGPNYHGQVHWRPAALPARPASSASGAGIVGAAIARLTGDKPYQHLVKAAELLREQGICAVEFPVGAGLTTLIAALVIERRQASQTTLILAPTRQRAEALTRKLRAAIATDPGWKAATEIAAPGATPGASVSVRVVDPRTLDSLLRDDREDDFLRDVGLVVVVGAHALVGTAGQHVSLLLRRLNLILKRLGGKPQVLAECMGAGGQSVFLLGLLAGFVPPGHLLETQGDDGTSRREVRMYGWIPNLCFDADGQVTRRSLFDEVAEIAASAAAAGLHVLVVATHPSAARSDLNVLRRLVESRAGTFPRERLEVCQAVDEAKLSARAADVVVYAGTPRSIDDLHYDVSLLGADRGPSAKVAIVVAPHEPLALHFVLREEADQRHNALAGLAVLDASSRAMHQLHLRAAIGSRGFDRSELEGLGYAELDQEIDGWLAKGWLATDERKRFGSLVPAGGTGDRFFHPLIDLEAAGDRPVAILKSDDANDSVAQLEQSRLPKSAFPKALFVSDGVRYEVEDRDARQGEHQVLFLNRTAVVNRVTYAICETSVGSDESGAVPIALFGAGDATAREVSLNIDERVVGYVAGAIDEPMALSNQGRWEERARDEGRLRRTFETSGVVLSFPPDTRAEAIHAFAHAFRVGATVALRFRPDDLGMGVIPAADAAAHAPSTPAADWRPTPPETAVRFQPVPGPALAVYDDVAAGSGVAGMLSMHLGEVLRSAFKLLMDCPCEDGCNACLGHPGCKRSLRPQGPNAPTGPNPDLDKRGAIGLLSRLLPANVAYVANERTQLVTAARELARIANDIREHVFGPMLGIDLIDMPTIVTEKTSEGVLGFYQRDEHAITLKAMKRHEAYEVLAHELAHAWTFRGGFGEAILGDDLIPSNPDLGARVRKILIEGFAQWVAAKTMDYFGFTERASSIAQRPPDEYGLGFRLFMGLENDAESGGVRGVIRLVAGQNMSWLGTYFNSSAFAVERSAIIENVDGGSSGPDWDEADAPAPPPPAAPAPRAAAPPAEPTGPTPPPSPEPPAAQSPEPPLEIELDPLASAQPPKS